MRAADTLEPRRALGWQYGLAGLLLNDIAPLHAGLFLALPGFGPGFGPYFRFASASRLAPRSGFTPSSSLASGASLAARPSLAPRPTLALDLRLASFPRSAMGPRSLNFFPASGPACYALPLGRPSLAGTRSSALYTLTLSDWRFLL